MKRKLKLIVEDNTTKKGKIFDYSIQFLIILSLIAFSLETLPNNSEFVKGVLYFIEVFCVVVFSIEYLLRIYVADKPLRYIFSFFGMVDLLAILPFYLNFAIDLRSLRAFRIFRIFRALKLVRYNRALRRFRIAADIVREEIILFFMVASILIFLSAAGIYFFENQAQPERFSSIFDSLWWAVVTLTTVGYGDVFPVTIGGKIFTFFVLIIGVGIVTLPAGIMATALTKARTIEEKEEAEA
ncbi:MAG: voltage-gated potassium channel [Flavobacteriaceae bacterium]|nr:voltage-gated potassium channel [Flavobacteriaceae bacterium]|tara:strand:+ start:159432 stop:160154 length:723 start_codon:yes stop_codon:yes gene_type:complete